MSCYESTPLHFATNEVTVNELLSHGADVNALNCSGDNPLHSTVIMGRELPDIKTLTSPGAKVNAEEASSQFSALYYANYKYIVKELISHGADANSLSYQGRTLLHLGIHANKDISVIEALLSGGVDPNAMIDEQLFDYDSYVETPLVSAMSSIVKPYEADLLLSAGYKITGRTVLHNCFCPETARLLISLGADVYEKYEVQDTVLQAILRFPSASNNTALDIVRLFLKSGANMNVGNSLGSTPIEYARQTINLEEIRILKI